jgi:isopentenyl-diphosphate delta-isomerase
LCFFSSRGSSEETDDINGIQKAAKRRLLYVFGIDVLNMDKIEYITRVHYKALNEPFDNIFGEHEIDYILFIKSDYCINHNKNEIKSYKYVNEKELVQILKNEEYKFTPWFKLICDKFIFKWWPHINNLENIKDDKNIQRFL